MADDSRYALLIAVSHYEHDDLAALPKTLRDVVDLHDVLVQSYDFSPENVRILWDHPPVTKDSTLFDVDGEEGRLDSDQRQLLVRSATEESVPLAVEEFLSDDVNPDDFRFLYYGGHGLESSAGEFYLALRKSKPNKAAIGISGSALKKWIKNGSKRQLLILDSCNAAAMIEGTRGALPEIPIDFLGDAVLDDQQAMSWEDKGEGRFLLAASKKYQAALETLQFKPQWRNSVYTHHLLAGLRDYAAADDSHKVTPHSLHSFVVERVPGDTAGKQEPRLQALDGTGASFALARKPKLPNDLQIQIDSDSWKDRQAVVARLKADCRNLHCAHSPLALAALKQLSKDADRRVSGEAIDALRVLGEGEETTGGKTPGRGDKSPVRWKKIVWGFLFLGLASGVVYEKETLRGWVSRIFSGDTADLQKAIANQQWSLAELLCREPSSLSSSTLCTADFPKAKQRHLLEGQLIALRSQLAGADTESALLDLQDELQDFPAEFKSDNRAMAFQSELSQKLQQQALVEFVQTLADAKSEAQLASLQSELQRLKANAKDSNTLAVLQLQLDNKIADLDQSEKRFSNQQAIAEIEQLIPAIESRAGLTQIQNQLGTLYKNMEDSTQLDSLQAKLFAKEREFDNLEEAKRLAAKVQQLLAQGTERWKDYNFTTPEGAAALDSYRQVLQIQPSNAAALQGVERIVAYYDSRAESAIAGGDWTRAESMIQGLQRVGSQRPEVGRLQAQMAEAKQQAAQPWFKEMQTIKAGSFTMGSPTSETGRVDDEIAHEVQISPFKMGKYAVSNAWYVEFLNDGPHTIPYGQRWFETQAQDKTSRIVKKSQAYSVEKGFENYPVVNVSWYGAKAFVNWLNKGKNTQRYRLPSEAEWEYAARGGTSTAYWWGDSVKADGAAQANCGGCGSDWDSREPAPVDTFEDNPSELWNTSGNTLEWVEDCYSGYRGYINTPTDGTAKIYNCDRSDVRVLRGGSWSSLPQGLRSANRGYDKPNIRSSTVGFRVAQDF